MEHAPVHTAKSMFALISHAVCTAEHTTSKDGNCSALLRVGFSNILMYRNALFLFLCCFPPFQIIFQLLYCRSWMMSMVFVVVVAILGRYPHLIYFLINAQNTGKATTSLSLRYRVYSIMSRHRCLRSTAIHTPRVHSEDLRFL